MIALVLERKRPPTLNHVILVLTNRNPVWFGGFLFVKTGFHDNILVPTETCRVKTIARASTSKGNMIPASQPQIPLVA